MNNLAEKLDEYLDEQAGFEEVQRFVIDDKDKADWAVRKIVKYQQNITEAKELAQKRIAKINEWLAKETEENQQQIAFFEALLRPFAEQELNGSKKKSLSLPSGTLGFRKAGPRFMREGQPVDGKDEKLTAWVKKNAAEFLVVKETTNWVDFKKTLKILDGKAITPDGEILPGISVDVPPDTFYVKGAE